MRLLVVNPNTLSSMSDLVAATAAAIAGPGVEIRIATGRFGPRYVGSRAAAAIASHAALDAFAEHGADCDAVLLACFGDPGLNALREIASVPVTGLAEASCHLACQFGRRFSIVTGGERWGPMLGEFVAGLGLSSRLASVRTVAPTGAAIAADPEGSLALLGEACCRTVAEDGAEVVILGGAGLAGLAERLAPRVPVPVLCSVEAGVRAALAAAGCRPRKAAAGSFAPTPPVESTGLSPALARLLSGTS